MSVLLVLKQLDPLNFYYLSLLLKSNDFNTENISFSDQLMLDIPISKPEKQYEYIVLATSYLADTSMSLVCSIVHFLKKGGKFLLLTSGTTAKLEPIQRDLVFAGLLDTCIDSLKTIPECVAVYGKKPLWLMGINPNSNLIVVRTSDSSSRLAWKTHTNEKNPLKENSLVDNDRFNLSIYLGKESQKPIEEKKACKNCSCRRNINSAELINKESNNTVNNGSACGNCYLGDAFRCTSCPYKGLPALKTRVATSELITNQIYTSK
jgi:hypothetical protein